MLWTTEASGDACYLLPIFYHISHLACRQDHIIVLVCEFFILFAHIVRVYDQIKLELFKKIVFLFNDLSTALSFLDVELRNNFK